MIFKYKNTALTCDEEIVGFTTNIPSINIESQKYYGNKYFICESVSETQAKNIAQVICSQVNTIQSFNFIVE